VKAAGRFASGYLHSRVERSRGPRFSGPHAAPVPLRNVFGVHPGTAPGVRREQRRSRSSSKLRVRPESTGARAGSCWADATGAGGARSWRAIGMQPRLAGAERADESHGPLAARTHRRQIAPGYCTRHFLTLPGRGRATSRSVNLNSTAPRGARSDPFNQPEYHGRMTPGVHQAKHGKQVDRCPGAPIVRAWTIRQDS
jgi:hypothetical protein